MKTRIGFVSNSSSSSFIILKENLSETQLYRIRNHISIAKKLIPYYNCGYACDKDAWSISETDELIEGSTGMDNFDMKVFLTEVLKIPEDYIKWK